MDDFKKIIIPLLGVAVFIIFVGLLYNKDKVRLPESKKTVDVKIGSITVKATLADNEELRKAGLGEVDKLAENEGMLFMFDKKDVIPSFWMKGMKITIDILWLNDGKIVQIDKNIEPPKAGTKDNDLAKYKPDNPIDYVLEVNGGYSDKNGIKEQDAVEIPNL